jgi:large subunit ribosomal protein L21
MYAIFKLAGFQFGGASGDRVRVPKLGKNVGEKISISDVLLIRGTDKAQIGTPFVAGAKVEAEVVEVGQGEKLLGYKYKRRTKSRKTYGHRQDYTDLKITRIAVG